MSTKGKTKHTRRHRGSTRTQVQGTRTHGARMQGTCTRKQRALPTSALSTSLQEAVCKHQGSAGVWIWAILVSQRCVMVHLPWRHVERRSFDHTFVFQLRSCVLAERMLRMPRAWAAMLLVCARRCQSISDVPRFRPGIHADSCVPRISRGGAGILVGLIASNASDASIVERRFN